MRTYLMDALGGPGDGQTWGFYSLEYPGYGSRGGSANQSEIIEAAEAALRELLKANNRPIYIAGESLGSGVACLFAAKYPGEVHGLFLVTPYTSIADVAASQFPMFPVRLILQDKYEAAQALKNYSGRVAVSCWGERPPVRRRKSPAPAPRRKSDVTCRE